nr:DUF2585 family protein [Rhodoligotrophos appendicifer]
MRSALPYIAVGVAIVAATALILLLMGRTPLCTCGTIRLWVNDASGPENSQQIADWYTLSHIIHGFLFYGVLWTIIGKKSLAFRAVVALLLEATWEILENSSLVIDRYRSATVSLHYVGDSILNSTSDILFMLPGFFLAAVLPVWISISLIVAMELLALSVIRDNLALNILMLLYPVEAIRQWQAGIS